jgi:stress response protein YsnF
MAQTVVGLFEQQDAAQKAVERLMGKGISRDQVDLSMGTIESTDAKVSNDRDGHKADGVTGFFNSLFGVDSDDAKRYSTVARDKRCAIVTVHARSSEQAEHAADLLDDCGAMDVSEHGREVSGSRANISQERSTAGPDRHNEGSRREGTTIPRMEEHLEVGKRTEERGSVRVRSRIVEKPVEEHVRLREEHVQVERHPVNRPVSDSERSQLQNRDIELTERAEVPVVNKEARVVEEVRVSKEVTERDQTVRDTVRHTEIEVDKLDRNEGRSSDNSDLNRSR